MFEGIRVYDGRVFKLDAHVARLYKSAKAVLLDIPLRPEEMCRTVREAVEENGTGDGYIRLVVTRGVGDLGVNPFVCPKATVIIIVGAIQLYPPKCYAEGIAIITSSLRRVGPACFDVRIKSLDYLNNALAKIEAAQAGCLEAVMLNGDGFVAECTGDNIFVVADGVLKTPRAADQALEGITRAVILQLASGAGVSVMETALTQYDLYTAGECFLTGTGAEVMPVTKVDGRVIGDGKPGAVTRKLSALFHEEVRRA